MGGLSVSDTFTVEVKDDVPPVLPTKDIFINGTVAAGAFADFSNLKAIDKVDGVIMPISCTPDDSAAFSVAGSPHLIMCEATDMSGNTGSASFNLYVLEIAPLASVRSIDLVGPAQRSGAGGGDGRSASERGDLLPQQRRDQQCGRHRLRGGVEECGHQQQRRVHQDRRHRDAGCGAQCPCGRGLDLRRVPRSRDQRLGGRLCSSRQPGRTSAISSPPAAARPTPHGSGRPRQAPPVCSARCANLR